MDWNTLSNECMQCRKCGLCEGRRHVVFGTGNREAEILLVGEGPGEQEDLQGEPFVGPAGRLLDDLLDLIDLDRRKVYIANIVKCRPPGNRDPSNEEQQACLPYLRAQTAPIRPKIIVCLGRIAAGRILHEEYRISREHGQWTERSGVWLTATFHPSALLRSDQYRAAAWEDLKGLRAKAEEICTHTF